MTNILFYFFVAFAVICETQSHEETTNIMRKLLLPLYGVDYFKFAYNLNHVSPNELT